MVVAVERLVLVGQFLHLDRQVSVARESLFRSMELASITPQEVVVGPSLVRQQVQVALELEAQRAFRRVLAAPTLVTVAVAVNMVA